MGERLPERARLLAMARALHGGLLIAAFAVLTARAFLELSCHWAFLAYHLPGALSLYGLTSYAVLACDAPAGSAADRLQ